MRHIYIRGIIGLIWIVPAGCQRVDRGRRGGSRCG